MNLSYSLARIAVQVPGTGLGLFFKFLIALIGRGLIVNCVGLILVDGLLFHGSGSSEDRGLILARRTDRLVDLLGSSRDSVILLFALGLCFHFDDGFAGPAKIG